VHRLIKEWFFRVAHGAGRVLQYMAITLASPDLSAEDVDDSDEIFGANATAKQKSEFLKCLAAAGF
jgi:hypothetical protein